MRVSVHVPRQGEQTCDASAAPELCLARRPQDLAELQAVAGRLPCLVGVCQARGRNLLAAAGLDKEIRSISKTSSSW